MFRSSSDTGQALKLLHDGGSVEAIDTGEWKWVDVFMLGTSRMAPPSSRFVTPSVTEVTYILMFSIKF